MNTIENLLNSLYDDKNREDIMQTIPVEIPDKLAAMLDAVCLENGKIKQAVIKELLIRYLEDIEDIADAERVIALNEPGVPLKEVRRDLGLDY